MPNDRVLILTESQSHGHAIVYTCMSCSTFRRIPAPPNSTQDKEKAEKVENQIRVPITKSPEEIPEKVQVQSEPGTKAEAESRSIEDVSISKADEGAQGRPVRISEPRPTRKRRLKVRSVPFFAKGEHVVFAGNNVVNREQESVIGTKVEIS